MSSTESIRELAGPLLAAAGLELWDVEISRDRVRIMVERPGGVDLEALSAASTALSPLFDEHDELAPAGAYELEVSSPGVERSLRTPEQYRRYLGTTVSVKTKPDVEGPRRSQGALEDAGPTGIRLVADDGSVRELAYDQVERARTVLDWGPQPKPAGRAGTTKRTKAKAREMKDTAS